MQSSEILVIGHRNPDTDSITSAIGYAEFKRQTGMPQAVAARCGDTNDRIDFVLKFFGMPAPKFVANVAPKIRDVMNRQVVSVYPHTTVAEALAIMEGKNIRVLPILNDNHTCRGVVSVFKMSKFFLPAAPTPFDSRRVVASLRNLTKTLDGELIYSQNPDREEDLTLMIGAMSLGSLALRMNKYSQNKLVMVVGDRDEIQHLAIEEKVRVIIVTGGLPIEPHILKAAKENKVSLISSPHDSATTAMLCRAAITVTHMTTEEYMEFQEDEPLANVQQKATESPFHAFPVHNAEKQIIGLLSKSDFLKKVDRKLILVDHNELSQAVHGAEQVEILEIIDHHRIGALTTAAPILFRNEPVGSTSTIVAECFFQSQVEIPHGIAGLLLAGLVSDTLNLTSPTSTDRDANVLKRLEKLAQINASQFTEKLFASGSVLVSRPPHKAITTDCKEYLERGSTFSVAQIEEIGFDNFWKKKKEVLVALEAYRAKKNYFFSALLVTDVVQQTSLLLVSGPKSFLDRIDYPEIEVGVYELEGVVSRKKQLLPYLTHALRAVGSRVE